ncbi:FG-GAP-like repeat-containing protein [Micromonospora coerulea]|uniref:FG-GAP-like repeat-containing protein n=1 Tax=Micromonospora coerulea TaxID=47856 RepID=UPI00190690A3|nr:FG-GAP-like repeat-containing protein [Micromonospora veneta]
MTGDGRADVLLGMLVHADPSDVYDLLVFAQQADGSLASPVRYQTGLSSSDRAGMGVTVLDANGDGRRDVALATKAGVQVLTQTTEGRLAIRGLLAGTAGAEYIAAADMDRDGDEDLVVNGEAGTMLLRQESSGVFVLSVVGPEWVYALAVGDVDGDGWRDIALSGRETDVLVYHRTTTGWRRTAHTPIEDYWGIHEGIEIADVTGDGRADVAVTDSGNRPGALLNVFRQTATGTLAAPVVYSTPDIPQPVKAADLNGDGRKDLVIAHGGWQQVTALLQQSDGTLGSPISHPVPYATHYHSQGLALGDIDGDKRVDAVLADQQNNLVVLRNIHRAASTIAFLARVNNRYVTAESAGAKPLIANRTAIGLWEQFDMIDAGNGFISLRSRSNGKYVTAESAGAQPLIANRTAVGSWEKFKVIYNSDGSISLRANVNGKYVTAEKAGAYPLIANRTAIGLWEKFDIHAVP